MSVLDRRHFVKAAATAATCLGLPMGHARAKSASDGITTDWAAFRAELKKRQQPGVIVVLNAVPADANRKKQLQDQLARTPQGIDELGQAVQAALFNCGNSEMPALLLQAVFVLAPAFDVRQAFPAVPTTAGLVLIDPDGKVLRSIPASADLGQKFIARTAELLYGKDGAALAERVKAERAALGAAACQKLDAAFIDLDSDDFTARQEASRHLSGLMPRIPASLLQAFRAAPSLEARVRIDSLFRKKLNDENAAVLLQRSLAQHVSNPAEILGRIRCGQGALPPRAHQFVQLWSRQEA